MIKYAQKCNKNMFELKIQDSLFLAIIVPGQ